MATVSEIFGGLELCYFSSIDVFCTVFFSSNFELYVIRLLVAVIYILINLKKIVSVNSFDGATLCRGMTRSAH